MPITSALRAIKVDLDLDLDSTRVQVDAPLELHLTTPELWFGQEQEGILP